jgi:hypothetical protein
MSWPMSGTTSASVPYARAHYDAEIAREHLASKLDAIERIA